MRLENYILSSSNILQQTSAQYFYSTGLQHVNALNYETSIPYLLKAFELRPSSVECAQLIGTYFRRILCDC